MSLLAKAIAIAANRVVRLCGVGRFPQNLSPAGENPAHCGQQPVRLLEGEMSLSLIHISEPTRPY